MSCYRKPANLTDRHPQGSALSKKAGTALLGEKSRLVGSQKENSWLGNEGSALVCRVKEIWFREPWWNKTNPFCLWLWLWAHMGVGSVIAKRGKTRAAGGRPGDRPIKQAGTPGVCWLTPPPRTPGRSSWTMSCTASCFSTFTRDYLPPCSLWKSQGTASSGVGRALGPTADSNQVAGNAVRSLNSGCE